MTSSTQAMEYTINFKSKVKGNAILRIVDKLPYKLDLEKSNIAEGVYDENALTITWEQAIAKVDDEIHDVNVTKQISLVYKDVDLTKDKITNTVTGKITLTEFKGEGEDEETFETENAVEGKVKIRYVEKETGKDLAEAKEIRGKVGTDYKTDAIEINGYTNVSSTENTTGKITEAEQEVIYYYESIVTIEPSPEPEPEPTKPVSNTTNTTNTTNTDNITNTTNITNINNNTTVNSTTNVTTTTITTNTQTPVVQNPIKKVIYTGDEANIKRFVIIAVMSGAYIIGMIVIIVVKKRKTKQQ